MADAPKPGMANGPGLPPSSPEGILGQLLQMFQKFAFAQGPLQQAAQAPGQQGPQQGQGQPQGQPQQGQPQPGGGQDTSALQQAIADHMNVLAQQAAAQKRPVGHPHGKPSSVLSDPSNPIQQLFAHVMGKLT